ncbi:hypothetical protein [Halalkalibacter okhensis]|nr:hypothetical protein [Halalkalibacter okhensis]
MDTSGIIYAAATEIPESKWDIKLIPEVGTLRKLFINGSFKECLS